jgi:hypothetical protein
MAFGESSPSPSVSSTTTTNQAGNRVKRTKERSFSEQVFPMTATKGALSSATTTKKKSSKKEISSLYGK